MDATTHTDISHLLEILAATEKKYDVEKIKNAFEYAKELHCGQFRASGEEYISHPIAVAEIVAGLELDTDSICAALLHDTVEDCSDKTSLKDIEKKFGSDVALLVDGLTKIITLHVEDKEEAKAAPAKKEKQPKKEEKPVNLISIDNFFKAELKTAKVLAAEAVPEADKLLKLQIDVGGVPRQIVAGIAKSYTPESLIGKTIVIVSNLQPAKIRGIESCGMLLAAKAGKELKLVTVDGEIASGASVG